LHRGIAGSCTFINYVGWGSVAHFTQAFDKPEFRENMVKVLPITVMSPHLFKKVAIAGVCVDLLLSSFRSELLAGMLNKCDMIDVYSTNFTLLGWIQYGSCEKVTWN